MQRDEQHDGATEQSEKISTGTSCTRTKGGSCKAQEDQLE